MRFRLDPRGAEARPPPPAYLPSAAKAEGPPANAPAEAPPPMAPAPGATHAAAVVPAQVAAAIQAVRARRTLAIGIAIALLLTSGVAVGAMYALDAGPFAYPNKYILQDDEIPRGLRNAPLDAEAREELGLTSNPGEVDPSTIVDDTGGPRPERAWVQGLTNGASEPIVVIVALDYGNRDDADDAASRLQAGCMFRDGFTLLRDGDVLVLVMPENGGDGYVASVVAALKRQNADLSTVCA